MTKTLNEMLLDEFNFQAGRLSGAGLAKQNITIYLEEDYSNNRTIKYTIGHYGDTDKVEGRDLHDIVTEFMRRKGWTEANKPMTMLAAPVEFNDATTNDDKYTI